MPNCTNDDPPMNSFMLWMLLPALQCPNDNTDIIKLNITKVNKQQSVTNNAGADDIYIFNSKSCLGLFYYHLDVKSHKSQRALLKRLRQI